MATTSNTRLQRRACGDFGKLALLPWMVLAAIGLLAAADLAQSEDTDVGRKVDAAIGNKRSTEQAYGLLVGRYPSSDRRLSDVTPMDEPAPTPEMGSVRPASWVSGPNDSMAPPPVQLPSPTETMSSYGGGCSECECCNPLWCYRNSVFVDFLYLRPGNIDYIYAVEQTGTLPTDSPTGPVGRVGFDGAPGYRIGFNYALTDCSGIQASYTWFQDGTSSTINATPGTVLIFQPGLPSIPNVGASSVQASARYDIRFQQFDVDYRGLLYGTCNSAVNYFAGLRYANLNQRLTATEDVGVPVGLSTVRTQLNFDGFGIGGGLDGMRRSAYSGLLFYGRSSASFVSGEFKADFRQTSQFLPTPALGNTLVDYRVMTILQAELGGGWQSDSGAIRVTAGYMFAGWFNALTTGSYIPGVQNRQFNNLNETITFDGLVSRFEYRF